MKYALHQSIFVDAPCKLCAGHTLVVIGTHGRRRQPLTTTICRDCGLIHSYPIPSKDELDAYYARQYRSDYKGTVTPKRKHILRYSRVAVRRLDHLRQFATAGRKLLDVGSGSGEFVYMASLAGFDAQGLEPHAGYSEYTRAIFGVPVITAPLEKADIAENTYDIITLHHVLEHLHYPLTSLGYLNRWLKMGGLLAVEVPDIEFTRHSVANRFHHAHVYNFNHATLTALLDKAGFELDARGVVASTTVFARKTRAPAPERHVSIPDNYHRLMAALFDVTAGAGRGRGRGSRILRLLRKSRRYLLEYLEATRPSHPRVMVEREFRRGQAGAA